MTVKNEDGIRFWFVIPNVSLHERIKKSGHLAAMINAIKEDGMTIIHTNDLSIPDFQILDFAIVMRPMDEKIEINIMWEKNPRITIIKEKLLIQDYYNKFELLLSALGNLRLLAGL